jgi:hypothetical protein
MAARTGTVLYQSPTPPGVTSRIASVTVTPAGSTTPNPVILLDYTSSAPTFAVNDGDTASANSVDSDSAGPGPVSNTITAVVVPAVTVPASAVLTGFSFI